MNLDQMHEWFRLHSQQMGLQNVRALLPEEIDNLINTSINDIVKMVIEKNIGTTNDRIITDNVKIGQINELKSLYKVIEINATPAKELFEDPGTPTWQNPFIYAEDRNNCRIQGLFDLFTDKKGVVTFPNADSDHPSGIFEWLYLVDFNIKYKRSDALESDSKKPFSTNIFPVRLVDYMYIANLLNDHVSKPRVRHPAAVIYNNTIDVYLGDLHYETFNNVNVKTDEIDDTTKKPKYALAKTFENYYLDKHLIPDTFIISYISKPKKVKYLRDFGAENEETDLDELLHIDMLKHAVDLFRIAQTGSMQAGQGQEQSQQREMVRNQARPENEGYQN